MTFPALTRRRMRVMKWLWNLGEAPLRGFDWVVGQARRPLVWFEQQCKPGHQWEWQQYHARIYCEQDGPISDVEWAHIHELRRARRAS